jgi:hypothetical protein
VAHRLQELGPHHNTAIRMRLEGLTTEKICETLEVQPRTVYLWFSDPLIKAELARRQARINEVFAERLASAAAEAIGQLREMLELPVQGPLTPETKLKVIREILDRAAGGTSIGGGTDNLFSEVSSDELLDAVERLATGTANGESPAG